MFTYLLTISVTMWQVFKFLNQLYHNTRDYERIAADQMLARYTPRTIDKL